MTGPRNASPNDDAQHGPDSPSSQPTFDQASPDLRPHLDPTAPDSAFPVPVALPVASSNPAPKPRQSRASGPAAARNTSPAAGAGRPAERPSRQAVARLRRRLSERDRAVLDLVAEHRFLTTTQLEVLVFAGQVSPLTAARTSRRVLRRLHGAGLLRQLDRRVGGIRAGSASFIWSLTEQGHRLRHVDSLDQPRLRYREPSQRLLDHALAIADVRVRLVIAARDGRIELTDVQTEPACWRSYLGDSGERLVLQPDLAAVTAPRVEGQLADFEDCWFLEVDLGTEHLPTVLRKCAQYETYRRTGSEQQRLGIFPAVVWIMSTPTRAAALRAAIARTPSLDARLFRITTPDRLVEDVIGGPA